MHEMFPEVRYQTVQTIISTQVKTGHFRKQELAPLSFCLFMLAFYPRFFSKENLCASLLQSINDNFLLGHKKLGDSYNNIM